MLDTTLAATFIPGTNLRGDVAGAKWTFLLPSLELEQIVCIGTPTTTTLRTLSRISQAVVVFSKGTSPLSKVREVSQQHGLDNIHPVITDGGAGLPLLDGSIDLVFITDGSAVRELSRNQAMLVELKRLLKPEGLLYFEPGGPVNRLRRRNAIERLTNAFGPSQRFWLTPWSGDIDTAVPADDRHTIRFFLRHRLDSSTVNLHTVKDARQLVVRHHQLTRHTNRPAGNVPARPANRLSGRLRPIARDAGVAIVRICERAERFLSQHTSFVRRFGVLMGRRAANTSTTLSTSLTEQPPRYLRSIARDAGIDIDNHHWGLVAPGDYSSRKVLFFLFNPSARLRTGPSAGLRTGPSTGSRHRTAGDAPEYIVKLTRDPAFNPRLENEYRALSLLREQGIGDPETLPRAVFFGYHAGLAIVGETAIHGAPFRQRTRATADCPYVHTAIDWLIELGAATADRTAATRSQVAESLRTLFSQFVQVYQLAPADCDFLSEQIAAIGCSKEAFPLVFQHGDPGLWNILVTSSGRVAFLDWEAAEPRGMPLWDLFYFMRSYSIWGARAHGTHDRLQGFAQQFLALRPGVPSPSTGSGRGPSIGSLVVEATRHYCERTGLAMELVEPLFYTCWMHRALKESTRLTPARIESGTYVNLLRLCIEQRNAPTLRRLFSPAALRGGHL